MWPRSAPQPIFHNERVARSWRTPFLLSSPIGLPCRIGVTSPISLSFLLGRVQRVRSWPNVPARCSSKPRQRDPSGANTSSMRSSRHISGWRRSWPDSSGTAAWMMTISYRLPAPGSSRHAYASIPIKVHLSGLRNPPSAECSSDTFVIMAGPFGRHARLRSSPRVSGVGGRRWFRRWAACRALKISPMSWAHQWTPCSRPAWRARATAPCRSTLPCPGESVFSRVKATTTKIG